VPACKGYFWKKGSLGGRGRTKLTTEIDSLRGQKGTQIAILKIRRRHIADDGGESGDSRLQKREGRSGSQQQRGRGGAGIEKRGHHYYRHAAKITKKRKGVSKRRKRGAPPSLNGRRENMKGEPFGHSRRWSPSRSRGRGEPIKRAGSRRD